MEWIERLNKAINYIEAHITEEIDFAELAKIACCSTYHFQRMFAYMAEVTLSEYIRRRRMSLAAVDLQSDEAKIIDVALKYGYHSPTAFNRAFQNVHGIAPSLVKNEDMAVKSYPPISFKVMIKGVQALNYRIVKKDAFRIVGISLPLVTEGEKNLGRIAEMFQSAAMNGMITKLTTMMNNQPMGLLGVSVCDDVEAAVWRYYISVSTTKEIDDTMEAYLIPPFTWAVFSGEGSREEIRKLQERIITEWLPTSGYEYDDGPDIEVYLNDDPLNTKFEAWIPVKKVE